MPVMSEDFVQLTLNASNEEVWALAEFVKRVRWGHFLECAVNEEEAYQIKGGVQALDVALREKGFTPR